MSDQSDVFVQYGAVVDALKAAFRELSDVLGEGETLTQYEFTGRVKSVAWLREELSNLIDALRGTHFRIVLATLVHDYMTRIELIGPSTSLKANCEEADIETSEDLGALPPDAVSTFERYQQLLEPGAAAIPFEHLLRLLESLARAEVPIKLSLELFLDKTQVNNELLAGISGRDRPKLIAYLFPEAMLADLKRRNLTDFERAYARRGQRTVIVVFGLRGQTSSSLLAILGCDDGDRLSHILANPLTSSDVEWFTKVLEFRAGQGVWLFPTDWLLPEMFDVELVEAGAPIWTDIRQELLAYRTLLSIVFLADYVEYADSSYRVEFTGFGRVHIPVDRPSLYNYDEFSPAVYQLYSYCYDGLSADKLEIAQQFLSLITEDLHSLCRKAHEVKEATKKTYDRALVDKVSEYFDARKSIQDRISGAVSETAAQVIQFSRHISTDLYKVAGVIAAATIAALLETEITTWGAFFAAAVIGVYALIVLRFHLPTLERSFDLGIEQHLAYIRSFEDILRAAEIEEYEKDKRLRDATAMFKDKYQEARRLYRLALIVALAVVLVSAILLLSSSTTPTQLPATSTPIP